MPPNNQPHPLQRAPSGMESAAAGLFMVAAFFASLAGGATSGWALAALHGLLALGASLWLIHRPSKVRCLRTPAIFLLIGFLYIAPLPDAVIRWISPVAYTAQTRAECVGVHPSRCLSVAPGSTLAAIRHLLLLVVAALAISDLVRTPLLRRRFTWALALAGVAQIILGVASWGHKPYLLLGFHDMTGPIRPWKNPLLSPIQSAGFGYPDTVQVGAIRYTADAPVVGDIFGSFISSNHFATCLMLTIPFAMALIIPPPGAPRRTRIARTLAAVCLGAVTLITVSSGARAWAGTGILLLGIPVAVLLGTRSRRARIGATASLAVLITAASLALTWITRTPATQPPGFRARLRSSAQHRLRAWRAAAGMFRRSPWVGVGLGNFGNAYPAFAPTPPVDYAPDNEYLRLAAEGGAATMAVVAAMLAVGWRRRRVVKPQDADGSIHRAAAGSAVAMCLLHALCEHPFRIPALAYLFAIVLALLLARSDPDPTPSRDVRTWRRFTAVLAVVSVLALAAGASAARAVSEVPLRRLHVAVVAARTRPADPVLREDIARSIPAAESADRWAWKDAGRAQVIARAWLRLSDGMPSRELDRSWSWFAKAVERCPLNESDPDTLQQIHLLRGASTQHP